MWIHVVVNLQTCYYLILTIYLDPQTPHLCTQCFTVTIIEHNVYIFYIVHSVTVLFCCAVACMNHWTAEGTSLYKLSKGLENTTRHLQVDVRSRSPTWSTRQLQVFGSACAQRPRKWESTPLYGREIQRSRASLSQVTNSKTDIYGYGLFRLVLLKDRLNVFYFSAT